MHIKSLIIISMVFLISSCPGQINENVINEGVNIVNKCHLSTIK